MKLKHAIAFIFLALVCRASASFPDVKDLPVQTNLPDVMMMDDGTKVTTPEQWHARREEIKAILEHYELGHAPPPPGNVKGKVLRSQDFLDGTVQYRLVHISFGPHHKLGFDIAVFTPASKGPFPIIINPSALIMPGVTNNPKANPAWLAAGFTNIIGRGYAIVTYNHNETGVDNRTWRTTAYYPAYPGYDWGEMMGWAWGFSRIVDYLETQSFMDKAKIIGVGHSRRGKIVMTAAAFDDRIALVAPGGSGCMGSSAYRFCGPGRGGKEGIEAMVQAHYFWYTPLFEQFTNRVYQLPFDAHWVVALIAPRPYLAVDAAEDVFCVPNAVKQTYLAAKPVYEFLGVNPDRIGVHFENHPHELAATDWTAILDFADQQLRGIDHHRAFDQFPSDEVSPGFNVRDFGATGDGTNKDTVAFQKALDACAASGGGDVLVPPGNYLIGSVQMGSHTVLRLAQGSALIGDGDIDDYPMIPVRWEGRWEPGRRGLIYATNAHDITILGPGMIEGNAKVAAPQNPRGAVVLESVSCSNVYWQDFTVTQGGNWATHPVYCTNVVIRNVTITGKRDGIDVDSCRHVLIDGCHIDTSDDSISLKSGRGAQAVAIGRPTEDVIITNCRLVDHRFACVGIGSETSGGIRNVHIAHCSFTARSIGIYIKTRIGRAGVIENISGDDLDVLGGGFLRINLVSTGNSNTVDDPVAGLAGYPQGRNFSFSNVRLHDAAVLADASKIAPEKPLDGFSLSNITGTCAKGISLANIADANLSEIHVTGYTGELLTATNVQGTGLDELK